MKANIRVQGVEQVNISSLVLYPFNARRGDVEAIAMSIKAHKQYRPIVVQKGTNHVLAGNHTLKAMKKLGHKKILINYVDVDDATARKMVLADNRTSDLANYNEPLLKSLLTALPDLDGTGFTKSEVETLNSLSGSAGSDLAGGDFKPATDPEVKIGMWRFQVEEDIYDGWNDELLRDNPTKSKATKAIKARLGFPERPPVKVERISEEVEPTTATMEIVAITDIALHNLNPREGDVGAIIGTLSELGQYRPIVVNRKTGKIVVGNHTFLSAYQLGWEEIAVHYIDVDEEEEIKIMIVDNRTSDLATYDSQDLNKLLTMGGVKGTGYSAEEVAEILGGGKSKPSNALGRTTARVGEYAMRVHTDDLNEWSNAIYSVNDVAQLLGFPEESIITEVE